MTTGKGNPVTEENFRVEGVLATNGKIHDELLKLIQSDKEADMAGGFDPKTFSTTSYQKRVEKPWGYEIIWTPDDAPATGKLLHIQEGKRLSLQYHDIKRETLYLASGQAIITLSNQNDTPLEIPMEPNKGYHVMPGQVHRITAITDSDIFESSTPEMGRTVRIEDDAGRSTETEEMRKMENRGWNTDSK